MSGSVKLIPCPFCGGNLPLPQESLGDWWIGCFCGATGPVAKSEDEAAELWNRRSAWIRPTAVEPQPSKRRTARNLARLGNLVSEEAVE